MRTPFQAFQAPPVYTQRSNRMQQQQNPNNPNNNTQTNVNTLRYNIQHRERVQLLQKERLLQQQQKQSMVVPSNATADPHGKFLLPL